MEEFDQSKVTAILDQMADIEASSYTNRYKSIEGKVVPRVTEVLSAMLHDDSLMTWSNSLGWKRIGYRAFMKAAAEKGTYTHLAIERFIKNGSVTLEELGPMSPEAKSAVDSAFSAFVNWWEHLKLKHKKIRPIYLEETLIHPYFGGTCDCVLEIDDQVWLVDFKTSNHMSYNYALQLAAYRYLLKELRGIIIDKAMVLMMDKVNYTYTTYELDMDNVAHRGFIDNCLYTFMLLVAGFKMRYLTTEEYYKVFGIEPRRR